MAISFISVTIYSQNFIDNYRESRTIFERFFFSATCFFIIGKSVLFEYNGILKLILENKRIVYLGKISYGIYLFHPFISTFIFGMCRKFNILDDFFKSITLNNMFVQALIFFGITIIISSLSYQFVEQPLIKLKNKF